jgi:hypothetical protein
LSGSAKQEPEVCVNDHTTEVIQQVLSVSDMTVWCGEPGGVQGNEWTTHPKTVRAAEESEEKGGAEAEARKRERWGVVHEVGEGNLRAVPIVCVPSLLNFDEQNR